MTRAVLVLIKEILLTAHEAHYAGGVHLFRNLISVVSSCQQHFHSVHTFCISKKCTLLYYAATQSLLHKLTTQVLQPGVELVSWRDENNTHHNVVVVSSDDAAVNGLCSSSPVCSTAAAALILAVSNTLDVLNSSGLYGRIILDVDSLQHANVLLPCPLDEFCTHGASTAACSCTVACPNPMPDIRLRQQQNATTSAPSAPCQKAAPFLLTLASHIAARTTHSAWAQQYLGNASASHCTNKQQHCYQRDQLMQQPKHQADGSTPQHSSSRSSEQGWQLCVLVQNLHHLPFGPCGTAPRSSQVLQGWMAVQGVICVSLFVKDYVMQHIQPLLSQQQQQQQQQRADFAHVVHPASLGVWGPGPFKDLGSSMAACLWGLSAAAAGATTIAHGSEECRPKLSWCDHEGTPESDGLISTPAAVFGSKTSCAAEQQRQQQHQQHQQQQWQRVPVVCMLKLTPEKGSDLFFKLAARLPQLDFVAVCADPQEFGTHAQLSNVKLLQPVADVSTILQDASVVLVPSVLQEAFGLVVVDAMLHGIPIIVAAAGALPEAAAGAAAAVLPVTLVEFPSAVSAAAEAAIESQLVTGKQQQGAESCQVQSRRCAFNDTGSVCLAQSQFHKNGPTATEQQQLHAAESMCWPGCSNCWLRGQRRWEDRLLMPENCANMDVWVDAVQRVLSTKAAYMQASAHARKAAAEVLQEGPEQLQSLLRWLQPLSVQV